METRHRKINMDNIEHKIQKDRHGATMGTRHRKIDTGNIGLKTKKDRHGKHWEQDTER